MTRRLFIDCGAAATVGALAEGDEIVRFFFAPARGDEGLARPAQAEDIVLGRIKTSTPALGGAFVDIGEAAGALLPDRPPPEGAIALFRVRRPALGGKGAILDADWSKGLAAPAIEALERQSLAGSPCILTPQADAAIAITRRAEAFAPSSIVVSRPDAAIALAQAGLEAATDERAVDDAGLAQALEAALDRVVTVGDGARMIVDETAGGAIVDIDAGATANVARKPNDRVNDRAARTLFRELARRGIGGRILVDFPPPSSPQARRKLLDILETQDKVLFERRLGKLAPDGLLDMTAPRRDLSLLERAGEPFDDSALRPGRRFTLDWAAKGAVAALELRLRRMPRARLSLDLGYDLARAIDKRPQWLARVIERHGARFALHTDERLEARSFDVREI